MSCAIKIDQKRTRFTCNVSKRTVGGTQAMGIKLTNCSKLLVGFASLTERFFTTWSVKVVVTYKIFFLPCAPLA